MRTKYVIVFLSVCTQTLVPFIMTLFHLVHVFFIVFHCECHVILRSVGFLFGAGKYAVVDLSVVTGITSCVTCNCLCTTKRAV